MLGVQLADVSTRCSSHPQGKSEARCENDGNFIGLRAHAVRCRGRRTDAASGRSLTPLTYGITARYLHFNSHHPVSAKRAAVRSLFDRARNITLQKEDLRKEEEHLRMTRASSRNVGKLYTEH